MNCFHRIFFELEKILSKKNNDEIKQIFNEYEINTSKKIIDLIEFWFYRTDKNEDNSLDINVWAYISKEILLLTGIGTSELSSEVKKSLDTELFGLSQRQILPSANNEKKIFEFFAQKDSSGAE